MTPSLGGLAAVRDQLEVGGAVGPAADRGRQRRPLQSLHRRACRNHHRFAGKVSRGQVFLERMATIGSGAHSIKLFTVIIIAV
jgi:hypothetical protein